MRFYAILEAFDIILAICRHHFLRYLNALDCVDFSFVNFEFVFDAEAVGATTGKPAGWSVGWLRLVRSLVRWLLG